MQRQRLEQKLLQKLSPQQIQLIKLLQLPIVALEQRIKQEAEENPAIVIEDNNSKTETDRIDETSQNQTEFLEDFDNTFKSEINENDDIEHFNLDDDYSVQDTEENLFKIYDENEFDDDINSIHQTSSDEHARPPYASGPTFRDYLFEQLSLQDFDDKQRKIGEMIIGNLDAAGYLRIELHKIADDLAIFYNIHKSIEEIEYVLRIIQTFEPPGIAARNLQEALLLQLNRLSNNFNVNLAKKILLEHYDEFLKKHYEKIIKKLNISEEDFKKALDIILKLNPKPGNSISEPSRNNNIYVIPDFIVNNDNGMIELTVNQSPLPELKFNRSYIEMVNNMTKNYDKLNEQQKQTLVYLKQKIDSAKWFIDAIKQRNNTLFNTMQAIIEYQKEYFETGDETKLKPMVLKDIAEKVNLDVSTISRVVSSKYVQTPYGTFLLKYFFSEGIQTQEGEEASSREVKKIIQDIIDNENKIKPLTDEQLVKILKQKGYNIARRTIAKYREQLNIPVARLRKQL